MLGLLDRELVGQGRLFGIRGIRQGDIDQNVDSRLCGEGGAFIGTLEKIECNGPLLLVGFGCGFVNLKTEFLEFARSWLFTLLR